MRRKFMRSFLCSSVLFCTMAILLAASCGYRQKKHTYRSISEEGWSALEPQTFIIDSLPDDGLYDVSVGIRTTHSYPYRSMWIIVEQEWENPRSLRTDTLKCNLTNEAGDFSGSGIAVHQYVFPVSRDQHKRAQRGLISIRHLMRREMLPGVSDIGLLFGPANPS